MCKGELIIQVVCLHGFLTERCTAKKQTKQLNSLWVGATPGSGSWEGSSLATSALCGISKVSFSQTWSNRSKGWTSPHPGKLTGVACILAELDSTSANKKSLLSPASKKLRLFALSTKPLDKTASLLCCLLTERPAATNNSHNGNLSNEELFSASHYGL